jgi:Zn-dependent protease with chaperone function
VIEADRHLLVAQRCACCAAGLGVPSRRLFVRLLGAGAAGVALGRAFAREGVDVGPPSVFTNAVPAEQIERAASGQYAQLLAQSRGGGKLATASNPQLKRLRVIASRIIPFTYEWNPRARQWKWEVNLIDSPQVNAFCMPGGKIAFFYGILERLQLVDDEVAMVMGHEMTHALREHSREQLGKTFATRAAIEIGAAVFGLGNGGRLLADMGGQLLTMKFGRTDETEADLVGLELAARAGYDPRAGVSLWQKMLKAEKGAPPQFLSTHPSGPSRIAEIESKLPRVMPLYERSPKPERRFEPPKG